VDLIIRNHSCFEIAKEINRRPCIVVVESQGGDLRLQARWKVAPAEGLLRQKETVSDLSAVTIVYLVLFAKEFTKSKSRLTASGRVTKFGFGYPTRILAIRTNPTRTSWQFDF